MIYHKVWNNLKILSGLRKIWNILHWFPLEMEDCSVQWSVDNDWICIFSGCFSGVPGSTVAPYLSRNFLRRVPRAASFWFLWYKIWLSVWIIGNIDILFGGLIIIIQWCPFSTLAYYLSLSNSICGCVRARKNYVEFHLGWVNNVLPCFLRYLLQNKVRIRPQNLLSEIIFLNANSLAWLFEASIVWIRMDGMPTQRTVLLMIALGNSFLRVMMLFILYPH